MSHQLPMAILLILSLMHVGGAFAQPRLIFKPIALNKERDKLIIEYRKQHYGINSTSTRIKPKMIVLHATESKNWRSTYDYFYPARFKDASRENLLSNSRLNVSAQYLVARDGTIYQLMPSDYFARHTIGLNNIAIGIENVGTEKGKDKLTDAQVASDAYLIRLLKKKYPAIEYLIGHFEYGKFRKTKLWAEKNKNYFTNKQDPGAEFMKSVRHKVNDLSFSD